MKPPTTTKPNKLDTRRDTRYLRCNLTRDELLAAGKTQADKSIELLQVENDRKRVADDFKAKASALEAEVTSLASKIASGYEHRQVDCTVYLDDPETGRKRIVRNDTGEVVSVEPMTQAELQRELIP